MLTRFIAVSFLTVLTAISCSTKSDRIEPAFVSPLEFQDFGCDEIEAEKRRILYILNKTIRQQDREATKDKMAVGAGVLLAWPAYIFVVGDDKKKEVAELKGTYDALTQAAADKNCNMPVPLAAPVASSPMPLVAPMQ